MELVRWCRLQWDRLLAVAAMVAGVVALLLGWAGASSTEFVAKQVPYAISGGLGGLVLLMIGGTLWLSADLRDEWRALDRLEERLAGGELGVLEEPLPGRFGLLGERPGQWLADGFGVLEELDRLQPAPSSSPPVPSLSHPQPVLSLSNPLARANGRS